MDWMGIGECGDRQPPVIFGQFVWRILCVYDSSQPCYSDDSRVSRDSRIGNAYSH